LGVTGVNGWVQLGVGAQRGDTGFTGVGVTGVTGVQGTQGLNIPRYSSTTSASTVTVNSATTDMYGVTALATGLTVKIPSGSPSEGQKLLYKFLDNGGAQTVAWDTTAAGGFAAMGTALPTTTTAGKWMYAETVYSADMTRWCLLALAIQS
jgi:hypothetical protein